MNPLEQRIAEKRRKADSLKQRLSETENRARILRQEIAIVRAELDAYEDALSLITGAPAEPEAPSVRLNADASTSFHSDTAMGVVLTRQRSISGHWKKILALMAAEHPNYLGYEEIEFYVEFAGHQADRRTIRSQMKLYKDRGFVESDVDGRFRVTEKGAQAADTILGRTPKNEALPASTESASKIIGEGDASPVESPSVQPNVLD